MVDRLATSSEMSCGQWQSTECSAMLPKGPFGVHQNVKLDLPVLREAAAMQVRYYNLSS
jgi:hypothetical protein